LDYNKLKTSGEKSSAEKEEEAADEPKRIKSDYQNKLEEAAVKKRQIIEQQKQ